MPDDHRYTEDDSVDITSTGEKLKLDTEGLEEVSVVLHDADNSADYVVECHYKDSSTDSEWHTLSDKSGTSGFRFQGTVPERYVRLRLDANSAGSGTGVASINAK